MAIPQRERHIYDVQKLSPRVRLAARLYATAAAPTKREASKMAGLHPSYLTMLTGKSEKVRQLVNDTDALIQDETVSSSVILQRLGRDAIAKISQLMHESQSEGLQLKAAIDLADRSPETSKTQKVQLESFNLDGKDVQALAAAMVEAAEVQGRYAAVGVEGLVEVDTDKHEAPAIPLPLAKSYSEKEDSNGEEE